MAKWKADVYADPVALAAAVEAIENTVAIQIVPFRAGPSDHFLLIRAGGS